MFGLFKKKDAAAVKFEIGAPMAGEAVGNEQIPDPVFADEVLGTCVAIKPTAGKVYAPCDGEISLVFDTKHAISMTTANGIEILIHIGLDTVTLGGKCFEAHCAAGDKVKKGTLLMDVDLAGIEAAGLSTVTPVIICNADDCRSIEKMTGRSVAAGDTVMAIEK